MKDVFRVIIVGAGPAALAAALSLARQQDTESPIHVTILELRDHVQTLGGAVNLTPLALRYLDSLGVGERLRRQAAKVGAIELVAHRTGGLLGRLWPDVDAIRVRRQELVEAMMGEVQALQGDQPVDVVFGAKIHGIEQFGEAHGQGGVRVSFKSSDKTSSAERTIEADLLLGCDGLHSQVRNLAVDPDRPKTYTGKCSTYGYVDVTPTDKASWRRRDEQPLITDTTLVQRGNDSLLLSYFEPSRTRLYAVAVTPVKEQVGNSDGPASREGWTALGADKPRIKDDMMRIFSGGGLNCVEDIVARCDDWFFFPIYSLSPGGAWAKGRVLLLGDAAHAMPPQGEGTGIAIEDGVLLARVLTRRRSRTVAQLFADYETLRRDDINTAYSDSMARWNSTAMPSGRFVVNVTEWIAWGYVKYMNYRHDYFARDVRKLPLPE